METLYAGSSLDDALNDQDALIRIGKSLSLERDRDKLLRTILYLSKKITGADAGSLFLLEENGEEEKRLRFKYSHTFSMPLYYEEFTIPFDTSSIAGYAAVTGKVLNIHDVYRLEEDSPISFNKSFDIEHGYRTKSMLVVPMRGTSEQIIGVIQLINSKEGSSHISGNEAFEVQLDSEQDFEEKVKPFKKRYEDLMEAVAGQAAIAIENNRMIKQIEQQFDSFVRASVMAIESRDPATHGHSFRVAAMTTKTAVAINSIKIGPLASVHFSPSQLKSLEFAGLLHDFGKVYIDPSIFLKGKKLYPKDYQNLRLRHNLMERSFDCGKGIILDSDPEKRVLKIEKRRKRLKEIKKLVEELNEPLVVERDSRHEVDKILSYTDELLCLDPDGRYIPLLTDDEAISLRIGRGTLNPEERKIIESHVEHTYRFVKSIPWPEEYSEIPAITYGHHEKLDGSGYPRGLSGREAIPIGARIMAIADIYDALSASDRPYKKAIPQEKVFDILREEAAAEKLDADILEVFIDAKAFDVPPNTTDLSIH